MEGDRLNPEKKTHIKKMIAPVIITVLLIIYFIIYFGLLIFAIDNMIIRILLGIIPLILGATVIGLCIQRIKEINEGEEDDLGKY
ncbi:MAG: hypothetical protein II149_00845 [Clostridia bacterium]|nr:hypothetical protein [Clostridia bacterium]MBQ6172013.1 hypothetical protein [Clostridia bacterium]